MLALLPAVGEFAQLVIMPPGVHYHRSTHGARYPAGEFQSGQAACGTCVGQGRQRQAGAGHQPRSVEVQMVQHLPDPHNQAPDTLVGDQ